MSVSSHRERAVADAEAALRLRGATADALASREAAVAEAEASLAQQLARAADERRERQAAAAAEVRAATSVFSSLSGRALVVHVPSELSFPRW